MQMINLRALQSSQYTWYIENNMVGVSQALFATRWGCMDRLLNRASGHVALSSTQYLSGFGHVSTTDMRGA